MPTPLYESLIAYLNQVDLRLHMPGHAGGPGLDSPFLKEAAALDVTEVPGIDDLHAARGALAQSQESAAVLYGARSSHYLVNGASSGIHALIMGLCREGETLVIPRNAHRSFWGGLIMSGAMPVYLPVQCEPHTGEAVSVAPRDIARVVKATGPSCRGLFLTSPSFLGTVQDLGAVKELCQVPGAVQERGQKRNSGDTPEGGSGSPGITLCVDEAHGGHFAFSGSYPRTALQCGAGAAVNGLHKNLGALNQGAILNLGAAFPEARRTLQALSLLTTTSPSFPILASIELALDSMSRQGARLLDQAREYREAFMQRVNRLPGLCCLESELLAVPGVTALDPLKTVIACAESGLTGCQLDAWLRREHRIQVEMSGPGYILAMFSPWHQGAHWAALAAALECLPAPGTARLQAIAASLLPAAAVQQPLAALPEPVICLSPRQAFYAPRQAVPLEQAAGRIAAEIVAAYPPGIPCIAPGELITPEIRDILAGLKASGTRIQGPRDLSLNSILVAQ